MTGAEQLIKRIEKKFKLSQIRKGQRVLVTLSGGLDSTVVLYFVKYLGLTPIGIEFNYKSRPKAEQTSLKMICSRSGTSLSTISYPSVKNKNTINTFKYDLTESNSLYYMAASNFAVVNGIDYIFGGLIKNDYDKPDGQNSYYLIERINELMNIEFGKRSPRIIMPFIFLDKAEVIGLGRFLKAPIDQTWSCEKDRTIPCGVCENCKLRILSAI